MSSRVNVFRAGSTAAILALAVAQAAHADGPASINIAGSTAFAAFFSSPGATNDYIDVNNDGIFGFNPLGSSSGDTPFVQQLAAPITLSGNTLTGYSTSPNSSGASVVAQWSVQYSGVGSVNGLTELVNYATAGTAPTTIGNPSYINRTTAVTSAGTLNYGTSGPAGFPVNTPFTSTDIAVMDVNVSWGVQGSAGTPAWNLKPTAAGYGTNTAKPFNATIQTNQLATLTTASGSLNLNTASPDSKTVFGTSLAFAPISVVANHGTGLQNVTQTQLQFLYVTGRMANGQNLVAATRDIGSGTRNGIMNSIGADPSWGTGENIGDITTNDSIQTALGPNFQPSNLDATGAMASVVTNNRLAVGYVSTTTGAAAQATGAYETLGVTFDLEGGSTAVRPTASTLINNGDPNSGYRIGGTETMATVGDPLATAVNASHPALTTNPQMANVAAAEYIRNIYDSINGYVANPSAVSNTFMPAQSLLASNFVPVAALQDVQSAGDATVWGANSAYSSTVNASAGGITGLNTGAYGSGIDPYGVVPTRQTLTGGATYSDGQTGVYRYYDSAGTQFTIGAGQALNLRNAIAGNFSGTDTSTCTISDIPQMMAAVANPVTWAKANNSGQVGSGLGNAAIPEILGDFNGDGNFDANDVRYFADGLAIRTTNGVDNTATGGFNDTGHLAGNLDRRAGFLAVDQNWTTSTPGHPAGNYFNTTLATGVPYQAGDSRGDIAGSVNGPAAGAAPTGDDGLINAADIDYEMAQIRAATGQSSVVATSGINPMLDVNGAYSTILARAALNPAVNVRADLSADINGDLSINKSDLDELVQGILKTNYGDANLDGTVNFSDFVVLSNHFGATNAGWEDGDFNGDGIVNFADFVILSNNFGATGASDIAAPSAAGSVPEPASLAVLGLGIASLLAGRRRTR